MVYWPDAVISVRATASATTDTLAGADIRCGFMARTIAHWRFQVRAYLPPGQEEPSHAAPQDDDNRRRARSHMVCRLPGVLCTGAGPPYDSEHGADCRRPGEL